MEKKLEIVMKLTEKSTKNNIRYSAYKNSIY